MTLRDEQDAPVALRTLVDRPVVLALVYYRCPMLCLQVLDGLARALRAVPLAAGRDFAVLVVSFDPRETAADAAKRRAQHPSWRFLTGDAAPLCEAVGFRARYDERTGQYAHASGVVVVTPDGRASRYFFGIDYAARDLRLALVESGEGRIGSAADRLMLLCYQYDPATGRYGFAILAVLRAAGVVTAGTLAAFILLALRRERRRRRV
jgi:protein SCO1/2